MERVYAGRHASVAGALATHFERGRDFFKSISFLIQAGDIALSRYANAEAVKYYSRGLDLVDKLPEGSKAGQQIVLRRKRAVSLLALGQLKESFADYAAMRGASQAAGNLEEECRALTGLTTVAYYLRELADIEQYGRAAMELAERIGNQALTAEAAINWAIYVGVEGRLSEAQSYYERYLPLARSVGHSAALPAGLMYRGLVHFWKSEYDAAERTQVEACQVAAEARDGFCQPLALLFLGLTRANRGRISEAMDSMQEALDIAKRNNHGVALSRVPNGIGWIWREIGDLSRAIEFDQGCVEISRRTRAAEAEANGLINLVYDYLQADEPAKAAEALDGVQPLYDRERWARWRFYGIRHRAAEAEYWLYQRKLDRAEEHARTLLANAQQNGVAKYIAIARRLLGEIAAASGDATTAEQELTRSLEPFATHPMPLIEWRNHAALGRLLAARNRPGGAREAFRRAETLVRGLAGNISDPVLRRVFLEMDAIREVVAGAAG
jgi:tetratricopeptide (TPR) repeat protein